MTDKYKALREAAQKAAPGPWRKAPFHPYILDARSGSSQTLVCTVAVNTFNDEGRYNEEFIAAANPTTILALLAERDSLERMFGAACVDLGSINEALDEGGAEPILAAISDLLSKREALRDAAQALVSILQELHHGRMPERVQTAFDGVRAALNQEGSK